MELIRKFQQLKRSDALIAGGKGASLGEMTQAGIPVPPGFVILAAAFEKFLKEVDLNLKINVALQEVNFKEIRTLEKASKKIQALILEAEIPKDIVQEIEKHFYELGAEHVAVRSSATAEDSAAAAWAGQLDTYLNTTHEELLQNIQKCWASLFTPRAIFYRFEKDLNKQEISVAVVVQKMVESEISGISFSVHPVTQDDNQLIIEAGLGLGEAIVSGSMTPDSYVVEKNPRRIIEKNIVLQARGLYANGWQDILESKGNQQKLSDDQIEELSNLILRIEHHYGFPCDVEWAYERGKFYVTQCRPITTLTQKKNTKFLCDLVHQYSIDKFSWTHKGFHGVLHTFFPVGRTGLAVKNFFGDACKITLFFVKDDYVHWYWNDDDLSRLRDEFFERLKKDKNYLETLEKNWHVRIKKFDRTIEKVEKTNLQNLSDESLSILYDEFYDDYVDQFSCFMGIGDALSMHADRYLRSEFQSTLGDDFDAVFSKLMTTHYLSFLEEESIAREKMLDKLRRGEKIPEHVLNAHAEKFFFIQNNYAKASKLTPLDFERILQEDKTKKGTAAPDIKTKQLKEKEQLIEQYPFSDWQKILIAIMDELFIIQDIRKKYVLIANYYQFQFLKEAERRTHIPFKLLQYSIYPEFRSILAKRIDIATLEARKNLCMCVHMEEGFSVFTGDEVLEALQFLQEDMKKEQKIRGMIASPGKVRGRVKKILKFHDIVNMKEGDVLVSSMTRPEMAPAMKLAIAIVTDEGGITSHAAIVSRELGIPCIIGTKVATQILNDGDLVEVDAHNGIVKLIK